MKLTIGDKLALLYSSFGSQRAISRATGISHQTIGRILLANYEGRDTSRYEGRPDLVDAVEWAYLYHLENARATARSQGLPFTQEVPIFAARMPTVRIDRTTGEVIREPGNRILAPHTHWITDRLRDAWITHAHRSRRYATITIRSTVNRDDYNERANQTANERASRGIIRTPQQSINRDHLLPRDHQTGKRRPPTVPIFTPRTFLDPKFSTLSVLENLNSNLNNRHSPATGTPGTNFAEAIYLQLDTRKNKPTKSPQHARKKAKSAAKRRTTAKRR